MKFDREIEEIKYDLTHTNEVLFSHRRQIDFLLNGQTKFCEFWRKCVDQKMSFLEVGVGGGATIKHFHDAKIPYLGIDISSLAINSLEEHNINCRQASCHQISFLESGSYDVVQHLDGMEHIPSEIENETLIEQYRISKKYILHANAMGTASLDELTRSAGLGNVHVNIKNEYEWADFYSKFAEEFNLKILITEVNNGTYYIVMEKI